MSIYINPDSLGKKEVTQIFANVDGQKKEIQSVWANKEGVPTQVWGGGALGNIYLFECVVSQGNIFYIKSKVYKGKELIQKDIDLSMYLTDFPDLKMDFTNTNYNVAFFNNFFYFFIYNVVVIIDKKLEVKNIFNAFLKDDFTYDDPNGFIPISSNPVVFDNFMFIYYVFSLEFKNAGNYYTIRYWVVLLRIKKDGSKEYKRISTSTTINDMLNGILATNYCNQKAIVNLLYESEYLTMNVYGDITYNTFGELSRGNKRGSGYVFDSISVGEKIISIVCENKDANIKIAETGIDGKTIEIISIINSATLQDIYSTIITDQLNYTSQITKFFYHINNNFIIVLSGKLLLSNDLKTWETVTYDLGAMSFDISYVYNLIFKSEKYYLTFLEIKGRKYRSLLCKSNDLKKWDIVYENIFDADANVGYIPDGKKLIQKYVII